MTKRNKQDARLHEVQIEEPQLPEIESLDELMTVKQAAKYLSISENILRLTIKCGKIPAVGKGRFLRVRKSDLLPFSDPLAAARAKRAVSSNVHYLPRTYHPERSRLSA